LNTQPLGIFDRSRIKSSPEGSAYPKHVSGAQRHTGLDYDPTTPNSRQSNIYRYSRSKYGKGVALRLGAERTNADTKRYARHFWICLKMKETEVSLFWLVKKI
jgi:hypothetical protein